MSSRNEIYVLDIFYSVHLIRYIAYYLFDIYLIDSNLYRIVHFCVCIENIFNKIFAMLCDLSFFSANLSEVQSTHAESKYGVIC